MFVGPSVCSTLWMSDKLQLNVAEKKPTGVADTFNCHGNISNGEGRNFIRLKVEGSLGFLKPQ